MSITKVKKVEEVRRDGDRRLPHNLMADDTAYCHLESHSGWVTLSVGIRATSYLSVLSLVPSEDHGGKLVIQLHSGGNWVRTVRSTFYGENYPRIDYSITISERDANLGGYLRPSEGIAARQAIAWNPGHTRFPSVQLQGPVYWRLEQTAEARVDMYLVNSQGREIAGNHLLSIDPDFIRIDLDLGNSSFVAQYPGAVRFIPLYANSRPLSL